MVVKIIVVKTPFLIVGMIRADLKHCRKMRDVRRGE